MNNQNINISDASGYPKSVFWVLGISQKMVLKQVEQGFSSVFAIILAYLMIFQSFVCSVWSYFSYRKQTMFIKLAI